MVANWIITLLIALAINVVSYLLMPKPKIAKPGPAEDFEDPTADMGRPIPIVFGTKLVKGLNIIGWWDKSKHEYEVKS